MEFLAKIIHHPGFQKYTRNVSWMLLTRVFTMGISFLTTLYIARTLGPTNFGELDYALAIIGLVGVVSTWGLEGVLNRELIKHPVEHRELVGTATLLRLMFGVTATAIVMLIAILSPVDAISKILLVLLSLTYTLSTLTILQQTFLARADSKYPSLITAGVTTLINLSKVAILTSGKGIIYLAAALVFEALLSSALYVAAYMKTTRHSPMHWEFSWPKARLLLKTGTAVAFLGAFAMIYSRVDQVMIKNMVDATAVGLYSAGVRLVDVWGFIPSIIGSALYPAVLNARKTSEGSYRKRLRYVFLLYCLPALAIALILSATARPLMELIYGHEFMGGYRALQVYAWSLPGTFIGFYVMNILFTDDYRKVLVVTTAIPAFLNVFLNLAWIPTHGIMGAAWATLVSYSLIPFVPLLFRPTRDVLFGIFKLRP